MKFKPNEVWEFSKGLIETGIHPVPAMYVLLRGQEVIYIGVAENARTELQEHLAGKRGNCTAAATHFVCQLASDPVARRDAALKEFQTEFGRLPECNEKETSNGQTS